MFAVVPGRMLMQRKVTLLILGCLSVQFPDVREKALATAGRSQAVYGCKFLQMARQNMLMRPQSSPETPLLPVPANLRDWRREG